MNQFYATYERAYFDNIGLYINLTRYDKDKFIEIFTNPISIRTIEDWKIYFHEYRHWIDSVSTNYGQSYLYSSFEMLTKSLNGEDFKVSPINPMVLHELLQKEGLIEIAIREKLESDDKELIWRIDTEFGHFHNIPVYIIKFIKKDGRLVCKTPITFLSLYETNAIYEELHLYYHFSEKINRDDPQKSIIDIIEYSAQAKRTYDSELIDYSVAAHLIACYFEIPAVLNIYDVAAQISTTLLNLTDDQLLTLRRNTTPQHVYHPYFFINRDFGYILYCICQDYRPIQKGNSIFSIDQFLDFFGLPKKEKVEQNIIDEMVKRVHQFNNSSHFYKLYTQLAMNGIDIFVRMGLNSRKETMFSYYSKDEFNIEPYLVYGDEMWDEKRLSDLTQIDIMKLSKYDWHDLVSLLRKSDEELLQNIEK